MSKIQAHLSTYTFYLFELTISFVKTQNISDSVRIVYISSETDYAVNRL